MLNSNNTGLFGGNMPNSGFGNPTNSTGGFLSAPSSQSTGFGSFGQQNTTNAGIFSQQTQPGNIFGINPAKSSVVGTGAPPFTVTNWNDGTATGGMLKIHVITAMASYAGKCLEELRLEDYNLGRKPAGMSVFPSSSGGLGQSTTSALFSGGSAFRQTPTVAAPPNPGSFFNSAQNTTSTLFGKPSGSTDLLSGTTTGSNTLTSASNPGGFGTSGFSGFSNNISKNIGFSGSAAGNVTNTLSSTVRPSPFFTTTSAPSQPSFLSSSSGQTPNTNAPTPTPSLQQNTTVNTAPSNTLFSTTSSSTNAGSGGLTSGMSSGITNTGFSFGSNALTNTQSGMGSTSSGQGFGLSQPKPLSSVFAPPSSTLQPAIPTRPTSIFSTANTQPPSFQSPNTNTFGQPSTAGSLLSSQTNSLSMTKDNTGSIWGSTANIGSSISSQTPVREVPGFASISDSSAYGKYTWLDSAIDRKSEGMSTSLTSSAISSQRNKILSSKPQVTQNKTRGHPVVFGNMHPKKPFGAATEELQRAGMWSNSLMLKKAFKKLVVCPVGSGGRDWAKEVEFSSTETSKDITPSTEKVEGTSREEIAGLTNIERLLGGFYISPGTKDLFKCIDELKTIKGFSVGKVGYGVISYVEAVDLSTLFVPQEIKNIREDSGGYETFKRLLVDRLFGGEEHGDYPIFIFEDMQVTVYPFRHEGSSDLRENKPKPGEGLNKRAIVRLEQCFPISGHDYDSERDSEYREDFLNTLKNIPKTKFVDYSFDSGIWTFEVDHF